MRISTCHSTVVLAFLLAACAGPGSGEPPLTLEQRLQSSGLRQGESVSVIRGFRLSSWTYLDETHIQVSSAIGDDYLITFHMPCWGLQTADAIAHTSTVGALSRHDRILARSASMPVNCSIRDIHALEPISKTDPQGERS